MKNYSIKMLFLILTGIVVSGCAKKAEIDTDNTLLATNVDYMQIFNAAQNVLKDIKFKIAKADPDAGIITTLPLSGQDPIEFWRDDAQTSKDLAYSAIHSIRKTVEIKMAQSELSCDVRIERLTLASKEITGFDDLPAAFSKSSVSRQSLVADEETKKQMTWVYAGNDHNLEQYILKKIKKQLEIEKEKETK